MFPELPEQLSDLTVDQLTALAASLREAGAAYRALDAAGRRENAEAAVAAAAGLEAVKAELTLRRQADDAFADDEPEDEDGDDEGDDDGDDGADDEAAAETVASSIERPGVPAPAAATVPATVVPNQFVAFDNVTALGRKMKPEEAFGDWTQLADALTNRAKTLRPGSGDRFEVAKMFAQFGDVALSESPMENLAIWDRLPEITAAWCASATPIYDISCQNTTARPVKNALMNFPAPRARVSIHPSPSLSDIVDTATGIWTIEDDDDDQATKGPCATITCGTPDEYDVYGVYACLTVKNLMTLNYPELIAAYLNRLAAAHARRAEIQLLNAMATSAASTIQVGGLGYGAATSITTQLMTYLAFFREQQRWDDQPFEMWAHRWLQTAIRIDLSRRNRDGSWSVASEADANRVFIDAGVTPHWFIDQPSWSQNLPSGVHTGGILNEFPTTARVLVNPVGKYAVMDRGELTVGVTGNNIYRDNASNAANEFTYFFENFEGIVDTGCPDSHILEFDSLCYSGFQIADVAIDCNGELLGDFNQAAYSS